MNKIRVVVHARLMLAIWTGPYASIGIFLQADILFPSRLLYTRLLFQAVMDSLISLVQSKALELSSLSLQQVEPNNIRQTNVQNPEETPPAVLNKIKFNF